MKLTLRKALLFFDKTLEYKYKTLEECPGLMQTNLFGQSWTLLRIVPLQSICPRCTADNT